MRLSSFAVVVTVLVMACPPYATRADQPNVKNIIGERVEGGFAAGIAVGIVHGDARSNFFSGTRSADGDQPIDENTIFEIGSISKVFTALLLAQMDDRGELKVTDIAQQFLPTAVRMPRRDDKQITLEHLATHRSGLPRMPSNFEPKDPANPYADYSTDQLYDFLSNHTLAGDIGVDTAYSNLGMGLLGHILARRAEMSYEQLMISRICKPLGMSSTTTKPRDTDASRVATGHQGRTPVSGWDIPTLAGAGDINSTLNDMVLFMAANLGMGETELYDSMKRCHKQRVDTQDPNLSVGLGWHISDKHGSVIVWHNGGTGGFASFAGFRNDQRKAVVVLSNSAYRGVDAIGLHLLNASNELDEILRERSVDHAVLEQYVGVYVLPAGVMLRVKIEDNRLLVKLADQEFYPIFAEEKDKFFYRVVEAKISFRRDDNGKVDRLVLHQGGVDQTAKRREGGYDPKVVEVEPSVLRRYIGKYRLMPGKEVTVTVDGSQLKAQLTGQPAYEVFAKSDTRFFYRIVVAEISFQSDGDGQIKSLTLHQAGMDRIAEKIE